ncbi:MAG: hypothetical protein ABIE42_09255 [Candidatus Eisenbacteria bacterium]
MKWIIGLVVAAAGAWALKSRSDRAEASPKRPTGPNGKKPKQAPSISVHAARQLPHGTKVTVFGQYAAEGGQCRGGKPTPEAWMLVGPAPSLGGALPVCIWVVGISSDKFRHGVGIRIVGTIKSVNVGTRSELKVLHAVGFELFRSK